MVDLPVSSRRSWTGIIAPHDAEMRILIVRRDNMERNPDLDEVIAYMKLKHLESGQSAFAAPHTRLASFWKLRRMHRLRRARHAGLRFADRAPCAMACTESNTGFSDGSERARRALHLSVSIQQPAGEHEVKQVFALAGLFGIDQAPPPPRRRSST
jgi:hypothetical protein